MHSKQHIWLPCTCRQLVVPSCNIHCNKSLIEHNTHTPHIHARARMHTCTRTHTKTYVRTHVHTYVHTQHRRCAHTTFIHTYSTDTVTLTQCTCTHCTLRMQRKNIAICTYKLCILVNTVEEVATILSTMMDRAVIASNNYPTVTRYCILSWMRKMKIQSGECV